MIWVPRLPTYLPSFLDQKGGEAHQRGTSHKFIGNRLSVYGARILFTRVGESILQAD